MYFSHMPYQNIPVDDEPIYITRQNRNDEPQQPAERSLIQIQQDAMRQVFQQSGISLATFAVEVANVARAAAAEGDYGAAANLYKLVGQHIGALQGEKHLHIHTQSQQANPENGDFRATSDDALRALIEQARQQNQIQDAQVLATETHPLPSPQNAQ